MHMAAGGVSTTSASQWLHAERGTPWLRGILTEMLIELERSGLDVVLAPSCVPECAAAGGMIRVVIDTNPPWYQALCARHLSTRTKPRRSFRVDTRVKRQRAVTVLQGLSEGASPQSWYTSEILSEALNQWQDRVHVSKKGIDTKAQLPSVVYVANINSRGVPGDPHQ